MDAIASGRWSLRRSRTTRIVGSFAAVLAAYWVYALAVVPLVEPSIELRPSEQPSESAVAEAGRRPNRRVEDLKGLFVPGSWELDNPKILESDQAKLILQDYVNLGEGKVELRPCTMVFLPNAGAAGLAERMSQAIVLQAPEGALLEFDQPFDLRRRRIGRLVSGQLRGQITIRSDGRLPGPEDDLLAVTHEVTLTEERIVAPHAVEFRLGPNYGRGSEMEIRFLPGERIASNKRHGPNVAGVESFELRRLERLHLVVAGAALLPAGEPAAGGAPQAPGIGGPGPGRGGLPVEIACRGPFRFDVVQQLATFRDGVDVLQLHPNGPSDQLTCELLAIYFARRRSTAPARADATKADAPATMDLQPRRIEARGNPVVIVSPAQQFRARGEQVDYDLWSGRVSLEGSEDVSLLHGDKEIHARSVCYQPGQDGRLGQATAQGPGWLRAQTAGRRDQPLLARWTEQLRLRPHEHQHVISLTGGAELNFAELGRLNALEIHLWLFELPPAAAGKPADLRPDRMLARQDVRLDSAQLSGAVEQLEVWFEPAEARPAKPAGLAAGMSTLQTMGRAAELAQQLPTTAWMVQRAMANPGADASPSAVAGGAAREESPGSPDVLNNPLRAVPARAAPADGAAQPAPAAASTVPGPAAPAQHFQVNGKLLQARVAVLGAQSELSELTVKGNVRFAETQALQPAEQPLVISGEQIHVADGSKPSAVVTVVGNPAHVEARGLGLTGANINLNRGANLLWIEGPGRMNVPLDRDLQGRQMAVPTFLDVRWQGRMAFDGRAARFEESVVAAAQHQQLQTHTLEVRFRQPVRFTEANARTRPEPEEIVCRGGVFGESRVLDEQGQMSWERMQVNDLAIHLISGAFRAGGPGWMSTVRRGSANAMLDLREGNPLAGRATTRETDQDGKKLVYLHVSFQDAITGNHQRREAIFRDRVRAVYGPVDSWETVLDPDRPETLDAQAVVLTCKQMSVVNMPTPVGNQRALELEAVGNTVVEGRTFTARSARMTYTQAKALLVLEGEGRTDAELFRQQYPGGPRSQTSARKIYYWHKLDRLRIDDARSFDMGQLPRAGQAKP